MALGNLFLDQPGSPRACCCLQQEGGPDSSDSSSVVIMRILNGSLPCIASGPAAALTLTQEGVAEHHAALQVNCSESEQGSTPLRDRTFAF